MKKYLSLLLIVALATSCASKKRTVAGLYNLKKAPKFALRLNSDSTFDFVFIIRNPYLHPFDHPGEEFSSATGKWHTLTGNKIVLKNGEQLPTANTQIASAQPAKKNNSRFVFYDVFHDTIPVLSVENPDSSVSMLLHRSMPFFETGLQPVTGDTLKFHFYGYEVLNFIYKDNQYLDYHIKMYPPKRADMVNNMVLKVRRKRLIATWSTLKLKFERSDWDFKL